MTHRDGNDEITTAVALLRSRFQPLADLSRRGPVPLAPFLEEFNLLQVGLPNLSRAAVYDYLLAEGLRPGDLGADEALAGFLYLTPSAGFVFVNGDDAVTRRRFTAAHELGHFLLHRGKMGGKMSFGDTEAIIKGETAVVMEREANRFAAQLLMPAEICRARAEEFRKAYQTCPRTPFANHLAAELLVSSTAMRIRLKELEVGHE